jgi:hypothetical protein
LRAAGLALLGASLVRDGAPGPIELIPKDRKDPRQNVEAMRLKQREVRAQDHLKGGDIDLLLLAAPAAIRILRSEKHALLAEFKREIGEQRIDLTLAEEPAARRKPFIKLALRTAILLKTWG